MGDPRNEMRCSVWPPKDGQFGKSVMVTFTINGVEYICFANEINPPIQNPKAPKYSGNVKLSNRNNDGQQPVIQNTTQPQAQTESTINTTINQEDDLPF